MNQLLLLPLQSYYLHHITIINTTIVREHTVIAEKNKMCNKTFLIVDVQYLV